MGSEKIEHRTLLEDDDFHRRAAQFVLKFYSAETENAIAHIAPLLLNLADVGEAERILNRELRALDKRIADELVTRGVAEFLRSEPPATA